jgi:hypothetical protein
MVTRQQYWEALDRLTKARVVEAQKAAEGEDVLASWWRDAEPVWQGLEAVLDQAEREDWARSAVWFDLWRDARRAGVAPGSVDTHAPVPTQDSAKHARQRATSPATRTLATAGASR